MLKSNISKELITRFMPEDIKAVLPTVNSDLFYFRIPINIKRSLSNNISKIQVLCQNQESFNQSFKNIFFSDTSNYRSYMNNSDFANRIGNPITQNVFLNYNKKSSSIENIFFKEILFDQNKFIYEENSLGTSNRYNVALPVQFSNKLVNNDIKNVRLMFIDNKNNIVDATDIRSCDFKHVRETNKTVDLKLFYRHYFLNNFIDTLEFNFDSLCKNIILNYSSDIDTATFRSVDIKINYSNGRKSVKCSHDNMDTNTYPFRLTDGAEEIALQIANNYVEGDKEFSFNIILDLKFEDSINVDPGNNSIILTKQVTHNRNSSIIRKCYLKNKSKIFTNLMKRLNLKQSVSLTNDVLKNTISISKNISSEVLKQIYIEKISLNNTVKDVVYRSSTTSIENRLLYKGKSIYDIFNTDNSLSFYTISNNRENTFKIELSFLDKKTIQAADTITSKDDFSSKIANTNKLLKRSLQIAGVDVNTTLSSTNKSIFVFKDISLININNFNDLAFSFGYVIDNQGDIKKFLENCIVKVENSTNIIEIDSIANKTNYFFFGELFNLDSINSGVVTIREDYVKNFIENDDYFQFNNIKRNKINENIIKFFMLRSEEESFKSILRVNSLNIENTLIIKILPIPEIISRFRGFGLDDMQNPIDSTLHSDVSNLLVEKTRLMRELVVFLYSGNSNLNWEKFIKFKNILFDHDKVDNVNNYSSLFNALISFNVTNNNMYKNITSYDRNELLGLTNTNELFMNSTIQAGFLEENFNQKYYNFATNNREFFIENMPYKVLFKEVLYNSNKNENKPRQIVFLKETLNKNISIDITYLDNFYQREQIASISPIIRMSLHFMLSNHENNMSNINVENTDFTVTELSGKQYLTYNNTYVEKNATKFSNLKNTIDNSLISINTRSERSFIQINTENSLIDVNNISYNNYSSLFDFCKINNISYLDNIILRFSISFEVPQSEDIVMSTFSARIPRVNLNNKKINIDTLNKIETLIVT